MELDRQIKKLHEGDIINIDENGVYYIGNNSVSKDEMADYLAQRFKDFPPLRIYLRADKDTTGDKITEFMDMAAEAGAVNVIFGSLQK